ncbi:MAG TPA: family 16 glycoside hydrolase [Thermoanaerobaculia bacterium]|nr:family 16 glycoside hydrolase [Thermoanaerobaculia bacterium]
MRRPLIALIVAFIALILIGCQARHPPRMRTRVLFEELFREPPLLTDRWEIHEARDAILGPSKWFLKDSAIWQTSNIFRKGEWERVALQGSTLVTRGGQEWDDCQITVKFKSTDDDGVGVVFRYRDEEHHYRFITVEDKENGGPFRRLQVLDGKNITTLAETTLGYNRGESHTIRIRTAGPDLQVWFDGDELSAKSSLFRQGKIGLLTYAENPIAFYFVRVTKEEPEPDPG